MSASREDVKITFRNILQISIGKMGSKRKGNKSATCKVNQSLRNTLWNQVSGLLMTLPVWDRTRLDRTRCDRSKGIRFKAQIVNCQSHWRHARVGRTKWGVRVEERGRESEGEGERERDIESEVNANGTAERACEWCAVRQKSSFIVIDKQMPEQRERVRKGERKGASEGEVKS